MCKVRASSWELPDNRPRLGEKHWVLLQCRVSVAHLHPRWDAAEMLVLALVWRLWLAGYPVGRRHWVPALDAAGTVPMRVSPFSRVSESFCVSTESSLKPPALSLRTAGAAAAEAAVLA